MSQEKLLNAKKFLFIALVIDMAVTALVAISHIWTVDVLNNIQAGNFTIKQSTVNVIEFWESFSKVMILTVIGVGLTIVVWLDACYKYARVTLKATGFSQEKWISLGWLIPFMNLFKPYQVLGEIYKVGASDNVEGEEWKKASISANILLWWIFWILAHIIFVIIWKLVFYGAFRDEMTLNQVITSYTVAIAACIISLILAGLWFVIAGSLTKRLIGQSVGNAHRSSTAAPTKNSLLSLSPSSASVAPIIDSVNAMPETAPDSQVAAKNAHSQSFSGKNSSTEVDVSQIYSQVAEELEYGNTDKGLWTRLWVECDGDDNKAKLLYIKQRTQVLINTEIARLLEEQLKLMKEKRQSDAESLRQSILDEQLERKREDYNFQRKEALRRRFGAKIIPGMAMRAKLASGAINADLLSLKKHKDASAFWEAILFRKIDMVRTFLDKTPLFVGLVDGSGNTPLHTAIRNKDSNLVELLIERGALPDAKNITGESPLDLAVYFMLPELARLLRVASEYNPQNLKSEEEIILSKGYVHSERKYECDKCGYTGQMYVKDSTNGPGNIICTQCGWEFEYTGRLILR